MHGMNGSATGLRVALRRGGPGSRPAWLVAACVGACSLSALADGDGSIAAASAAASSVTLPRHSFELAAARPVAGHPNTTRFEIIGWNAQAPQPALGLVVGVDTSSRNAAEGRGPSMVDVGVRWRSAPVNQRRIDVAAFRRINQPQDAYTLIHSGGQPIYAARVEMQFQSAKFGGLTPELGALGMQLTGGGKLVLRSKRGGPMVYYRNNF